MRTHFWQQKKGEEEKMVSITQAKKLLQEKGGKAWTEHTERDGTLFEVSEIELKGNNSQFKYNRHL
uniref:Uncharacterized protein n=1 Tax=viral metagenome TaxID=1070528 RepID=A0A6H1Z6Z2_9ZZZZ